MFSGLLLHLLPVHGLAWGGAKPLHQYGQDVWQRENGLPGNNVTSTLRARSGYLWVGTRQGLARFDGLRFEIFNRETTDGRILHDNVTALWESRDGVLWIGTSGGLIRYNDGEFDTYIIREGVESCITSITETADASLWFGTYGGGLGRFRRGSFDGFTTADGLPSNHVSTLDADGSDVWIGTLGGGLVRMHEDEFSTYSASDGLPDVFVSVLHRSTAGVLWVGTREGGLARLADDHFDVFDVSDGLPSNSISGVFEDEQGSLWIGTQGNGLARLHDGRVEVYDRRRGLPDDFVQSVYHDGDNGLWIGSRVGGLVRLTDQFFTSYTVHHELPHNVIRTVFEDSTRRLWIGTDGGGLSRFENDKFITLTTDDGLPSNFVWSIYEDHQGTLWVGTRGGGVARFGGQLRDPVEIYGTDEGLSNNVVTVISGDRDGAIWIGTDGGGINRLFDGNITTYDTRNGLSNDFIRAIHETEDGTVWIGTAGAGLSQFRDGHITNDSAGQALDSQFISTIYQDAEGTVWIGTDGGGLTRYDDGRWFTYTVDHGLPTRTVLHILDQDDYFWMASPNGIVQLAKTQLDAVYHGAQSLVSRVYGETDGMRSARCSAWNQPSAWQTHDGRLWFATSEGLLFTSPHPREVQRPPSPVVITDIVRNGEPVSDSNDELPPGPIDLVIRYTALDLLHASRTVFRYRLDGFDHDWIDAGISRIAHYRSVPPGSYRFQVVAGDSAGVWNPQAAALAVHVAAPFYQRYWFYGFCMSLGMLFAWGIHRVRERRLTSLFSAVLEERRRVAREMHDTIVQGIVGISTQLEALAMMLVTSPVKAREQLNRVRRLLRSNLDEARNALWDLRLQGSERVDLTVRLQNSVQQICAGSDIGIELHLVPLAHPLPPETEYCLRRVAQEAIRNVVQHARARHLVLSLVECPEGVRLVVKDDGIGVPETGSLRETGRLGLLGMRERVEQIGGQFVLASSWGAGTELSITVPWSPPHGGQS